ncbi:MAG: hypothetical protein KDB53_08230 [Planctomycetes bacterium]|nr:hypothetical protein [Planctomycetota bacterium]
MKSIARGLVAVAAISLVVSCSSVKDELGGTFDLDIQEAPQAGRNPKTVAPPQLEERSQDDHFLARIEKLTEEVEQLRGEKAAAEEAAKKAAGQAMTARSREGTLAEENLRLQTLLVGASELEKKQQEELLRLRLENVRLKQQLNEARIRELRAGAGH